LRCRVARALTIGALLVMSTVWAARSQNLLERLVMPGPLIDGHAKLEKDCFGCHAAFSRQSQTSKCIECHKEIAADRSASRGFHGRRLDAAKQDCRVCHTDHKGRDADIVQLDRETFDHTVTNFSLQGAHKTTACSDCHAQAVKFRSAPGLCVDCHKARDPHKGQLGEKCEQCHGEDAWLRVKGFDHDKTKFPLQGAHRSVECAACHAGERYANVATACVECHRLQDIHLGRYGPKCEDCHDQAVWKTARFNHDKTKFPLRGGHAGVKCDACHTGDLFRDKLATSCVSCHKKDDAHKGQLGSRCEQCHGDASWRKTVAFDHDLTRFPLIGRHAVVPCEECHRTTSFKDVRSACAGCHKDQFHEGRLGANCALCHNPNSWARWRFNHNSQTKYPLTGAHQGLDCHACHTVKNVTKVVLQTGCYGCHVLDDVHQGSFGRACERCHNTNSFRRGAIVR
jgi:hypothetical protein